MHPDLDDTRAVHHSGASARPLAPDLDDTVVRGTQPAVLEPPPAPRPADGTTPPPAEGRAGHGRARIRGGELFDLSCPVLIGRKPSAPRIRRGPEPRLVTVPSPSKEVSSTHLELRMQGTAIVVSDMRSTNGTSVVLPGGRSRTLLRGESAAVPPGSVIALGDGIVIDILGAELPLAESGAAS